MDFQEKLLISTTNKNKSHYLKKKENLTNNLKLRNLLSNIYITTTKSKIYEKRQQIHLNVIKMMKMCGYVIIVVSHRLLYKVIPTMDENIVYQHSAACLTNVYKLERSYFTNKSFSFMNTETNTINEIKNTKRCDGNKSRQ